MNLWWRRFLSQAKKFTTHKRLLLLLLSLAAVVAIATWLWLLQKDNFKPTTTYSGSLSGLIRSLEDLNNNLSIPPAVQVKTDLEKYEERIDLNIQYCRLLIDMQQPDKTERGKSAGTRISGICNDLLLVLFYTSDLHKKVTDYILLDNSQWPAPGSKEFDQRLKHTKDTISSTRNKLELLDNRKVQDPALEELLFQVKSAQEGAKKLQGIIAPAEAQKQAETLREQLARDQIDFLAARQYFWNNTIGIAQLLKSLRDVESAINPSQSPPLQ